MPKNILLILLVFYGSSCIPQQKILLVGTFHQTSKERLVDIVAIESLVEKFDPKIICAEFPMPTDSLSVMYKNGNNVFKDRETTRKEWKIPGDWNSKIYSLQEELKHNSNIQKRMELYQLYYVTLDLANCENQSYLIMTTLEKDTSGISSLQKNFASFKEMKMAYDIGRNRNNEYFRLVFPLASRLNISYINPIDDLSTWKKYEKYYERLQVPDSTDVEKIRYHKYNEDLRKKITSLPQDSNQWIFFNSPSVTQDLLHIEGYLIDPNVVNEDIKMLHFYWVQRNRLMAKCIYEVAKKHPKDNVVIFFGFSHVGAVKEELTKIQKKTKILTLFDLF